MIKQSMALTTTWWCHIFKSKTSVIRPAMTYSSAVWQDAIDKKLKTSTDKLAVMQNKTIAGAFKATVLEAETFIAPISMFTLKQKQDTGYAWKVKPKFIAAACKVIVNNLQGKAGRKRMQQPIPSDQKHIRARKMLANPQAVSFPNNAYHMDAWMR